jgi:hypothetical protein
LATDGQMVKVQNGDASVAGYFARTPAPARKLLRDTRERPERRPCGRRPWRRPTALGAFAEDGHDTDNFATLTSLDWQVHIYGTAAEAIRDLCGDRGLPLHEFACQSGMTRAGVRRNALYLVRPDGYVALATARQSPTELASYLDAHGLR